MKIKENQAYNAALNQVLEARKHKPNRSDCEVAGADSEAGVELVEFIARQLLKGRNHKVESFWYSCTTRRTPLLHRGAGWYRAVIIVNGERRRYLYYNGTWRMV
jgi:hypothetical protein